MLQGIVGYKRSGKAVPKEKVFVTSKQGVRSLRKTTVGWDFEVQWNDGSKNWVQLKILKESNPVEVAEFVTAKGLADTSQPLHGGSPTH